MNTIVDRFTEAAERHRNRTAIIWRGRETSYEALHRQSLAIARFLAEAGVGRGDRVCVCMEKGTDVLAVLLGGMLVGYLYLRRGSWFYRVRNGLSDWQRKRSRRKFEVYMRKHRDEPPSRPDRWVN